MPIPLLMFINNMCQAGKYVPNQFLTPYQLNRLDTDNYGAIINLDESQVKMMAGTYIFCRIMIVDILLNFNKQTDMGGSVTNKETVTNNFKVIATILYYIFMRVINKLLKSYERQKDKKGNDIYS